MLRETLRVPSAVDPSRTRRTPCVWLFSLTTALVVAGFGGGVAAAANTYSTTVQGSGPAGYWRLGDTSTTAADASGNARNGTYSGQATVGAAGAITGDTNTAVAFGTSSGVATVADAAALRLNGSFSIELWAKMGAFTNTWPGVVRKGASETANGYLIYYGADGSLSFKRNNFETRTLAGALKTTAYSHLVVTYDGAVLRWYVNGALNTSEAVVYPANAGTDPLTIGRGDEYGSHTMDEVALYNKTLTASEITNHHATALAANPGSSDPSLVIAGDIACPASDPNFSGADPSSCQSRATAQLAASLSPTAIVPAGDLVYGDRSVTDYTTSYGVSWGALAFPVHPVIGNHDYGETHGGILASSVAPGYFGYFGSPVANPGGAVTPNGQPGGWYSYDLGGWHIVNLNTECPAAGGCGSTSVQGRWFVNDLATHPAACTIVFGHVPRWFGTGSYGDQQYFWQRAAAARVDLYISGHDHFYERYAPRNSAGNPSSTGVRQFLVGTGGVNLEGAPPRSSLSQFQDSTHFGVMKLTLHSRTYDWRFVTIAGQTMDSGTGRCV